MDEDDLIKTGMEVVLRPVTAVVADVIGLAGGDYIGECRRNNLKRLKEKFEKVRGPDAEAPDLRTANIGAVQSIVRQAADEGSDELLDLWSKLLAAASDPTKSSIFRSEFIDIAKRLDPVDAKVLPMLPSGSTPIGGHRHERLAHQLERNPDEIEVSFSNLERLGLVEQWKQNVNQATTLEYRPFPSALGRQFLKAIEG